MSYTLLCVLCFKNFNCLSSILLRLNLTIAVLYYCDKNNYKSVNLLYSLNMWAKFHEKSSLHRLFDCMNVYNKWLPTLFKANFRVR